MQELSKYIVKLSLKKKDIGIVNICSGFGISLKKIVKKISFIENISPVIKFVKILKNPHESKSFWGSNVKLKFYLNK